MKTDDFSYYLPRDLIAYYPSKKRDKSRLLVLRKKDRSIFDHKFFELPEFLYPDDILVLNNTKVIPAKIAGFTDNNKRIDVLLTERLTGSTWKALFKNPKKEQKLEFEGGISGRVCKFDSANWIIKFNKNIDVYLDKFGNMPLPPYIEREAEEKDKETYQTVYAENEGAIAAPTAGLHFTDELLSEIKDKGIEVVFLTLHVGIGTFRPVKTENVEDHKLHNEYVEISEPAASAINKAKKGSRRVVAVGTTVVRALESSFRNSQVESGSFHTDLFIYPPYEFKVVDALITNFHLPKSTLLMLVSAFAGRDFMLKAYEVAIMKRYRFLSYGDAMFVF